MGFTVEKSFLVEVAFVGKWGTSDEKEVVEKKFSSEEKLSGG